MSVIKFGIAEAFRGVSVKTEHASETEAEYVKTAFYPGDPQDKADKEWLDANAPGWSLDLQREPEGRKGWVVFSVRIIFTVRSIAVSSPMQRIRRRE
jgi:hypothetical protein